MLKDCFESKNAWIKEKIMARVMRKRMMKVPKSHEQDLYGFVRDFKLILKGILGISMITKARSWKSE